MTPEQKAAVQHVKEIESEGFPHSLTSCPPLTRAMCRHRKALQELLDAVNRGELSAHEAGFE